MKISEELIKEVFVSFGLNPAFQICPDYVFNHPEYPGRQEVGVGVVIPRVHAQEYLLRLASRLPAGSQSRLRADARIISSAKLVHSPDTVIVHLPGYELED